MKPSLSLLLRHNDVLRPRSFRDHICLSFGLSFEGLDNNINTLYLWDAQLDGHYSLVLRQRAVLYFSNMLFSRCPSGSDGIRILYVDNLSMIRILTIKIFL